MNNSNVGYDHRNNFGNCFLAPLFDEIKKYELHKEISKSI